mmetsp:Transcript_22403/g.52809  ORF Transcript_22403/g.52809 Transcript_22403/m.52809 type:complete len:806 (+) Transcript_22403:105-2522(+)
MTNPRRGRRKVVAAAATTTTGSRTTTNNNKTAASNNEDDNDNDEFEFNPTTTTNTTAMDANNDADDHHRQEIHDSNVGIGSANRRRRRRRPDFYGSPNHHRQNAKTNSSNSGHEDEDYSDTVNKKKKKRSRLEESPSSSTHDEHGGDKGTNGTDQSKKKKPPPPITLATNGTPSPPAAAAGDPSPSSSFQLLLHTPTILQLADFVPSMESALGAPLHIIFRRVGDDPNVLSRAINPGADNDDDEGTGTAGIAIAATAAACNNRAAAGTATTTHVNDKTPQQGNTNHRTTNNDRRASSTSASAAAGQVQVVQQPVMRPYESQEFVRVTMLAQEIDVIMSTMETLIDRRRRVGEFRRVLVQKYCSGWGTACGASSSSSSSSFRRHGHDPFLSALIPILSNVLLEEIGDNNGTGSLNKLHASLATVVEQLKECASNLRQYAEQTEESMDELLYVLGLTGEDIDLSAAASSSSEAWFSASGAKLLVSEKQRLSELQREVVSRIDTMVQFASTSTSDKNNLLEFQTSQSQSQSQRNGDGTDDDDGEDDNKFDYGENLHDDDKMDVDDDSEERQNDQACTKELFPPTQDTAATTDSQANLDKQLYMPLEEFCAQLYGYEVPALHLSFPLQEEGGLSDPNEDDVPSHHDKDEKDTGGVEENSELTPPTQQRMTQTTYLQDAGNTPSRRAEVGSMTPSLSQNTVESFQSPSDNVPLEKLRSEEKRPRETGSSIEENGHDENNSSNIEDGQDKSPNRRHDGTSNGESRQPSTEGDGDSDEDKPREYSENTQAAVYGLVQMQMRKRDDGSPSAAL